MYDYDPSRGAKVPLRLLEGWRGYPMADGHAAYETFAGATPGIEQLACMVHARRRFVDAAKAHPHGRSGRADQALEYFRQLYKIEREAKEMTDAERYALRQARSVLILDDLPIDNNRAENAIRPFVGGAYTDAQILWNVRSRVGTAAIAIAMPTRLSADRTRPR